MKKGNKAILILVALLALYLVVGLLLIPGSGNKQPGATVGNAVSATDSLSCPCDSTTLQYTTPDGNGQSVTPVVPVLSEEDALFSYALGVIVARKAPREIADSDFSDAEYANFVKGMCDAFPVDASLASVAYANGLLQGAKAMEELNKIKEIISRSNLTKEIDNGKFFEGIKAMVTAENREMSLSQAYEYYNCTMFRAPSEEFMENITSRGGVEALKNGVSVKIESEGSGETATEANTIGYIYKASFINGNAFDSSRGEVVEAKVATLLPGLIDVVTTLPVGTKCKVYLPWHRAYGESGGDRVPPYSAIVYDLEIVKIVK